MEEVFTALLLTFIIVVPMLRQFRFGRQWHSPHSDSDVDRAASHTEGGAASSNLTQYDRHLHSIYHITFLLRQKLVADVVPAILRHADLLVPQCSRRAFDPALRVQQRSSPRYLVTSQQVLCKARTKTAVWKVVFDISSHDQGFADDPNAGSWTWFEAEVQRYGEDGKAETFGRRMIVRNRVADRNPTPHHIEWTADGNDEEQTAWVKSLKVGDRINVMAMAQYPGWTNHIISVQVTVLTVAVI